MKDALVLSGAVSALVVIVLYKACTDSVSHAVISTSIAIDAMRR